ncbi:hypothetical protein ACB094_11G040300 [Castanea mollissima]
MPPCFALLHFNKSFSLEKSASIYHPSYPKTASWQEDKHCCTWDGVECDKNTSLVVGLDLTSSWLYGNILSNSTLFFLPNLRRLNLADNSFNRSLIPSEFGNFKSLTHLNLSYSVFSGQIPFEISQLSSLVSLDLSKNRLSVKAPVWKRVIGNLTQLRELILDETNMSSIRPNSLMNLSFSLTTLSLRECDLQGKLENNILYLPSIQTLDLTSNWNLEGSLLKSNWSCSSLKFLGLSGRMFSREFLNSIDNLKSLKHLALPGCNITGSILAWPGILTKLTYLDLSNNSFSGLKNLENLDLSNNSVSINNNAAYALPNLQYLNLAYSNICEFPIFLRLTTNLQSLDLSNNRIYGQVPRWLRDVGNNSLYYVDLRDNLLQGPFPTLNFSNLQFIFFSKNNLTGEIPSFVCNATYLQVLDLSHNNLSGMIPKCLVNSTSLSVLDLRMNSLHGRIGNPKIKIPFPNLRIIDISNNQFNGLLPIKYFKYLKAMMNVNESEALKYMGDDYYHDSLNIIMKGQYIEMERVLTVLTSIDFSSNGFKGEMPKIIGSLKSLKGLNFSYNNLIGHIPSSIGNLTNLEWLDLSFNKLSEEIPSQLIDLTSLEVLKLSHNQLTGHIPSGNQFNTFNNDSYTNNSGLCGFPLSRTCDNHEARQPPPPTLQQDENLEHENGFGWQAVSIGYACGTIFGMFMGYLMLWWNTFSTGNYRLRPLDLSARLPRDFLLLS